MRLIKFLTLILVVLALYPAPKIAAAQKSITYKGLSLTPAIENIELAPDEPQISFKIQVENKQATSVNLSLSSLDFKSLNESGGVAFISSGSGALEHKYGLADWLSLPSEIITLGPNSSREVSVTVDNRDDLSPGGHYAAILFKNTAGANSGTNRVDVNQVVSTLVFLKKSGGEQYGLTLSGYKSGTAWWRLPRSLPLVFKNTGNTQTVPRGIVTIFGPDGRIYERGQININSGLVLPESERFYRTPLFSTAYAWRPGTYKVSITYRPEDVSQAQTVEYSFTYFNLFPPLIAAIAVLGCLAVRNYRSWQ